MFLSRIKPALLRQATYGTLKLGFYQGLKKLDSIYFPNSKNDANFFLKNLLFGLSAGALSNGITNPTDVLKIRMQSGKFNSNQGLFASFKTIYDLEGLRGLYRGVWPNMNRAAIVTGAELSSYDSAKRFLIERIQMTNDNLIFFWFVFILFTIIFFKIHFSLN